MTGDYSMADTHTLTRSITMLGEALDAITAERDALRAVVDRLDAPDDLRDALVRVTAERDALRLRLDNAHAALPDEPYGYVTGRRATRARLRLKDAWRQTFTSYEWDLRDRHGLRPRLRTLERLYLRRPSQEPT